MVAWHAWFVLTGLLIMQTGTTRIIDNKTPRLMLAGLAEAAEYEQLTKPSSNGEVWP